MNFKRFGYPFWKHCNFDHNQFGIYDPPQAIFKRHAQPSTPPNPIAPIPDQTASADPGNPEAAIRTNPLPPATKKPTTTSPTANPPPTALAAILAVGTQTVTAFRDGRVALAGRTTSVPASARVPVAGRTLQLAPSALLLLTAAADASPAAIPYSAVAVAVPAADETYTVAVGWGALATGVGGAGGGGGAADGEAWITVLAGAGGLGDGVAFVGRFEVDGGGEADSAGGIFRGEWECGGRYQCG
ncbi:uncharacterized protein F5Z01DRAFT_102773 [Neofusicoccum parvum]|uniref:Uncharacterized protein F5Z01DRAFT_102773 n=1 Tax=Neofusicoccum parvum TaxID=310453 RepID=A0ACB5RXC6_9PEZI|nr:uncharacterized protein F5Z01DRAFT_102773 [Neofusicoccum parvum]